MSTPSKYIDGITDRPPGASAPGADAPGTQGPSPPPAVTPLRYNFYGIYVSSGAAGRVWDDGHVYAISGSQAGPTLLTGPSNDLTQILLDPQEDGLFTTETYFSSVPMDIRITDIDEGTYRAYLYLSEGFHNAAGLRVFNQITVNGVLVPGTTNLDLAAEGLLQFGDPHAAFAFPVDINVNSGRTVAISATTSVGDPKINALWLEVTTPVFNVSRLNLNFAQDFVSPTGTTWKDGTPYVTNGTPRVSNAPNVGIGFQGPATDVDLDSTDQPLLEEIIYSPSGANGVINIAHPDIEPGQYELSLWFAQFNGTPVDPRIFNISLQSGAVTDTVDISGTNQAFIRKNVIDIADEGGGTGTLRVDLTPQFDLCTIAALRLSGTRPTASWRMPLTVAKEKVRNGPRALPILFVDLTHPHLRSQLNGGQVLHPQGYDMVLTNSQGVELPMYRTLWDEVAGRLQAFFKPNALSSTVDNVFYIYYGDITRQTDPSNSANLYQGYEGVWNMESEDPVDRTLKGHDGNASLGAVFTQTTSPIGGALTRPTEPTSRIIIANSADFAGATRPIICTYMYKRTGPTQYGPIFGFDEDNRGRHSVDIDGELRFDVGGFTVLDPFVPVLDQWYFVMQKLYWVGTTSYLEMTFRSVGGVPSVVSASYSNNSWYTGTNSFNILNAPGAPVTLNAEIGEFRIRTSELYTADDWYTESENYTNPFSFIMVGNPENLGTATDSSSASVSIGQGPNDVLTSQTPALLTALGVAPNTPYDSILMAQRL